MASSRLQPVRLRIGALEPAQRRTDQTVRAGESGLVLDRDVPVAIIERIGGRAGPDPRALKLERAGLLRRPAAPAARTRNASRAVAPGGGERPRAADRGSPRGPMRFWDSSAIVPLLVDEPAGALALDLLQEDPLVVAWWATPVECVSAIARAAEREGHLVPQAASRAMARLTMLARLMVRDRRLRSRPGDGISAPARACAARRGQPPARRRDRGGRRIARIVAVRLPRRAPRGRCRARGIRGPRPGAMKEPFPWPADETGPIP